MLLTRVELNTGERGFRAVPVTMAHRWGGAGGKKVIGLVAGLWGEIKREYTEAHRVAANMLLGLGFMLLVGLEKQVGVRVYQTK